MKFHEKLHRRLQLMGRKKHSNGVVRKVASSSRDQENLLFFFMYDYLCFIDYAQYSIKRFRNKFWVLACHEAMWLANE